jgi:type IV pilus assembly protein PilB
VKGCDVTSPGRSGFPATLLKERLISSNDLTVAEQYAARERVRLPEALVALGLATERDCYRLLAQTAGVPFESLDAIETNNLSVRLLPERLARRHRIVPLSVDNRTLNYATSNPFDTNTEADVAFASGRRTQMVVATPTAIMTALDRCYPKLHELDVLAARMKAEQPKIEMIDDDSDAPVGSAVIEMCNHIISRAVEMEASDIHLDCGATGTVVRYRICGVLEQVMTLPPATSRPIRNRLKIMARADIAVHNRPQDGAFRLKMNGRPIDIRFSTLPTVDGEKMVLRVIDGMSPLQSLERLGYDDETLNRLRTALSRPDGLVLVTGPTGCGKTTVLYAALNHLGTGRVNIVSVEDPVERTISGITQIPVNAKAGNTFPTVLRSLLRQDPNVIMVGEVRDAEVAQIVGQAAYTGHLVLSSLHTTDTATAILRLQNLGLEPFKIAESLSAVLAQRLLRSLCPQCRHVYNDIEARKLGAEVGIARAVATAGPGCPHCQHTGYAGRVPVCELLTPSDSLREAIGRGATAHEIRAAMRASGSPSLLDHALQLVGAGITSLDEVRRVLGVGLAEAKSARHPRVLVADDEPITRMLVKLLLEKEPFEVLEAANGQQAVEIATRERPDLVMIDLHMPEMDGYEAISRMRRDLSLATMPILVLTAEEGPGVERRVLDIGADDYLLKPFEPTVLLSRVRAVFRRQKALAA